MPESPKDETKSLKKSLEYVAKLISTAFIVILLLIGAFLIYYFISAKIVSKKTGLPPKLSLYTIVSGSMAPAINRSDIIVNVRIDDFTTLKIGDVITYKSQSSLIENMTITHRIIDVKIKNDGSREFITKGDYNLSADSSPVQQRDILGKTILKIPKLGQIQFLLATKLGWLLIVLLPALGIIIYDILKVFKVLGVTGKAEKITGKDITQVVEKEENKKIIETLEKIKKNPQLFARNHTEVRNNEVNEEEKNITPPIQNIDESKVNETSVNNNEQPESNEPLKIFPNDEDNNNFDNPNEL